jgi:pimeloyl-ACP methyl ester carboxylesterase
MTASPVPVVFIHGLWIHSVAWQPWVELYRSVGYNAMAPGWPGDGPSADDTRKNPAADPAAAAALRQRAPGLSTITKFPVEGR